MGEVNIKDVTDLIDYLLDSEANVINMSAADVDHSGGVAIMDLTYLIDLLLDPDGNGGGE